MPRFLITINETKRVSPGCKRNKELFRASCVRTGTARDALDAAVEYAYSRQATFDHHGARLIGTTYHGMVSVHPQAKAEIAIVAHFELLEELTHG